MTEKKLMTGNEAVAQGAWEAGIVFASAYPGTPSTEILENLVNYPNVYAEWAPNEKVALEAAIGASMSGVRAMATMKHVGLNVAADPLFTFSYTGVTGGTVIITADDPGLHSSQNEQDNRNYAIASKTLMLEPSDSGDAKEFMKLALDLSERFDTPVLLRMTTRICHSKSVVSIGEREAKDPIKYSRNIPKYVATPGNAKKMRERLIQRFEDEYNFAITEAVELGVNRFEWNESGANQEKIGVVTSGVAYQYAKDVFGDTASYLKLGMTYPMPIDLVKEFASKVDKLYVIEELDPYMERQIKEAGIECIGKELIPENEELNSDIVRRAIFGEAPEIVTSELKAAPRPPSLCAGCPHRGVFYALSKRRDVMITGDIGCYTLGSMAPLFAMDSCMCMGGSISMGHGAAKAFEMIGSDTKVVSVIGDSTFFHSGVTSLMDVAYNGSNTITIIMDNRITAMTGQQQNPGTGYALNGEEAPIADIPMICEGVGIKPSHMWVINPLDLHAVNNVLDQAFEKEGPKVIITKWPCALKKLSPLDEEEFIPEGQEGQEKKVCKINQFECENCKLCTKIGCPAIRTTKKMVEIQSDSCNGCGLCKQVCPFSAIAFKGTDGGAE